MASVLHLDDACLLNVFRFLLPLPDVFNVARTCKRFQGLMHDQRMWLRVHPACTSKEMASGKVFATLQTAIHSSRPGDTIWLSPGAPHLVSDLTVPWPLHLVGGGACPEDTTLLCRAGSDSALDFRATGKLANLRVVAERSACVVHRRGQLRVERCVLECRAMGLHHLCAPLVTLASVCHPPRVFHGTACMTGVGCGSLLVAETQLLGGSRAVRCNGSGALQDVRVLYHAPAPLFWFGVDCRTPGHFPARPESLASAALFTAPSKAPPAPPTPPAAPAQRGPPATPDTPTTVDGWLPPSHARGNITSGWVSSSDTGGCIQGWTRRPVDAAAPADADAGGCGLAGAGPGATPVDAVLSRPDRCQWQQGMLQDLDELSDGVAGGVSSDDGDAGGDGSGRGPCKSAAAVQQPRLQQAAGSAAGKEEGAAACTLPARMVVTVREATMLRPGRRREAEEAVARRSRSRKRPRGSGEGMCGGP